MLTVRRQSGTNTVQVVDAVRERLAEVSPLAPAGLRDPRRPRPLGVHQGVDPQRRGAPHRRLDPRRGRRARLPLELALDHHRGDRDPDVDHRDLRPDLVPGLHAELDDHARAHARRRHRHRRCDRRAGEHLPVRRGERAAADAGGRRSDARDRPGRARDDAVARRDLRSGRLHGRHRRPVHDELRLHDVVRDPRVAARQLHADADARLALDQDEAAARGCRGPRGDGADVTRRAVLQRARSGYTSILRWSLAHRGVIAGIAVLVLLSSVPLFMVANKNFLPNDDQAEFEVGVRAPEGTSLEATEIIANRIASRIQRLAGVSYTLVSVADDPARTQNSGTIYVRLTPVNERDRDQFELMNVVRSEILPAVGVPNLRTGVRPVATIGGGGNQNAEIQFTINGPDLKQLEQYANAVDRGSQEGARRRRRRHVAERRQARAVGAARPAEGGRPRRADFGCGRGAAAARRRRSDHDLQRRRRAVRGARPRGRPATGARRRPSVS